MNREKIYFIAFVLLIFTSFSTASAGEKYLVSNQEFKDAKGFYDDPRPFLKEDLNPKKILSSHLYDELTHDVAEMKKLWSEAVGFKAQDLVGKIASEITPGKYTSDDKKDHPGFKQLMPPVYYDRFNPGAPPFAGNFSEIEVVPTKQYYWSKPIAEATKKYEGKAKLDKNGILLQDTYIAGYPFPKPSGEFKANQIVYNWLKRYTNFDSGYHFKLAEGYSKSLKRDRVTDTEMFGVRLHGRVDMAPYGWFDKRAQDNQEDKVVFLKYASPRDYYGNAILVTNFLHPDKMSCALFYVNVLRRVRVLSGSDLQEPTGMGDITFGDTGDLLSRTLSDKIFPFDCEVLAEREYLVPIYSLDGSEYYSSEGIELKGAKFERRPTYVIKMTQRDKNFVYSSRTLYIDKETFSLYAIENYDQKNRLYRSGYRLWAFYPEMGQFVDFIDLYKDHLDKHSSVGLSFTYPTPWAGRNNFNMRALTAKGK